jgi:hypothetical protein
VAMVCGGAVQAATTTYETFSGAGGACSLANGGGDVACAGSSLGYATINVDPFPSGPLSFTVDLFGSTELTSRFSLWAGGPLAIGDGGSLRSANMGPSGLARFSFNLSNATRITQFTFSTSDSLGSHFQGTLSRVVVNAFTPVPGPIAGAGIPALLALGGFVWARRRKAAAVA